MGAEFILQFRYKKSRHVAKSTQRNVKNPGKNSKTVRVKGI